MRPSLAFVGAAFAFLHGVDADAFRDLLRPSPKADPLSLAALLNATREHPVVRIPGIRGGVVRGVGTLKADKYLGES
jgi:hypothetical protein